MFSFNKSASNIIAKKVSEKEKNVIRLLNGDTCIVENYSNNEFICDKLPKQIMNYKVFDIIVDCLKENGGKAYKGCGHNKADKVGYGKCSEGTVIYAVATEYYGRKMGESTFDPIFVLSAILDWAGVAKNCRGYIQLGVF